MFGYEDIGLTFSFSPFLFAAALIILGLYTYYIYRYTVPPVSPSKKLLLVFIRFAALLFILFIIFEPILTLAKKNIVEPVTLIFIDDSRSMTIDDGTSRIDKTKDFISEAESRAGGSSEFLTFGSSINIVEEDSLQQLNFNQGSTNFSDVLSVLDTTQENVSSVILLTDGVITSGSNPVFTAEKYNIPFFTIGVGDTTARNDIEIRNVLFNEYIYAETPTTISVSLRNRGFEGKEITAELFEDNKRIGQQQVKLSELNNFNFTYTPKTGGEKKLSIQISELEGEFTFANNRRVFFINVLDNKLNILILAGSPSPDLSFIKNSLALDENISISTITPITGSRYLEIGNIDQKIDTADIIFMTGFPSAETNNDLLQKAADAITRKGTPFLIIVTAITDFTKLKTFQAELGFTIGRFSGRLNEVAPYISSSDVNHPLLKNNAQNAADAWNKLPPVLQPDADFKPKPESEVLAEIKVNNVPVKLPLIIARKLGNKRSVAVLASNIWKWKLQTAQNNLNLFDSFINNSVKWLNTSEDQKQVNINTSKKVYVSGEEVEFTGQVYDATFNPVSDAEVEVKINREKESYTLLLNSIGGGLYEGTFQPPASGDFSYTGTAAENDVKIGDDNGKFNVGESDIEMMTPNMNIEMLSGLSSITGGKFYTVGDHSEIFDIIESINKTSSGEKTEIKEIDLWSDELLLIIVILLLGTEWFLRKRTGMI